MSEPDAQPMAPAEVASVRHEPVGSHLVRAARRGGKRKRHDTLLIADIALPAALDLKTHAQRMAVLEAVAVALATGKTSALAATTLLAVVKEARVEAQSALEDLVQIQAAEIERLRNH